MSTPLVSVLIPVYNAGRWIEQTLDCVFAQTWPRLEVVVVNDGSNDDSRERILRRRRDNLVLVDQPNRGQTAALNRCVAAASGEFIQYLDADDLLAPDKIELQMRRLEQHPGAIAAGAWARFRSDPAEAAFEPAAPWRDMAAVDWLVANWAQGGGMMYPAMWLLPRELVDRIGPWREELTLINDTEYFTRAVLAAGKVLFCEQARSYYRSGVPGSLSGLKSRRGWQSQFDVTSACERYLLGAEDSERTRRVCSMLWQRLAHASYPYDRRLANEALGRARALHPARLPVEGGPMFHVVAGIAGWKTARMLQRLSGRP